MQVTSVVRDPLVTGGKTVKDVSHDISRQVEGKPTRAWWMAFAISSVFFLFGLYCVCYLLWTGVGVWGLNKTVGWAWDITNFVWLVSATQEP
jgi:molybdopterin-containing oxidoreductase family membrane subunit